MSNRVRITFDFDLPDGADSDLIEHAIDDLELILQDLTGYSGEDLQRRVAAITERSRWHRAISAHIAVRVEVIR